MNVISSIDRDCGALAAAAFRASFASVAGPSHVRLGRGGDDAAAVGVAGDMLVGVVCDGAGSAQHGGAGARTLAPLFVEHLLAHAHAADRDGLETLVRDALSHGRAVLETEAASAGVRLASFATTLVACVATPNVFLHVQIGDGAFIALDGSDTPAYLSLGREQEYANETYFVTDGCWEESLFMREIARPRSILLLTDGVVPFALDGSHTVKTAFCVPIVSYLRESDPGEGACALRRLLTRPDVEDLVADDKTLLCVDVAAGTGERS